MVSTNTKRIIFQLLQHIILLPISALHQKYNILYGKSKKFYEQGIYFKNYFIMSFYLGKI